MASVGPLTFSLSTVSTAAKLGTPSAGSKCQSYAVEGAKAAGSVDTARGRQHPSCMCARPGLGQSGALFAAGSVEPGSSDAAFVLGNGLASGLCVSRGTEVEARARHEVQVE